MNAKRKLDIDATRERMIALGFMHGAVAFFTASLNSGSSCSAKR